MKNCLICHHVNEDDAFTCPKCGEASWSASTKPEAPAEEIATEETAPAEEPSAPVKRGRGRPKGS